MAKSKNKSHEILKTARRKRKLALLQKLKDESLTENEIHELEMLQHDHDPTKINFRCVDGTTLRKIFNISQPTLLKWVNKGLPFKTIGKKRFYNTKEVFRWRVGYQMELDGIDGELIGKPSAALEEFRQIKAEELELELKKKKAKYVSREEFEKTIQDCCELVQQSFSQFADRVADKIAECSDPNECQQIIDSGINQLLKELSLPQSFTK